LPRTRSCERRPGRLLADPRISMIATVKSGAIVGIEAYLVQVEVDVASRGLPKFSIVGLPEVAVRESKERVRTAILKLPCSTAG
jgi:hypothetical protein